MKRLKIISIILFAVLLLGSIGFNIKTLSNQKQRRQAVIGQLYNSIIEASRNLDSVVAAYDEDNIESTKASLGYASITLRKIDTIILLSNTGADESLDHPGILSFDFIADVLADKTKVHTVNDVTINCILSDDVISENEISFVKKLDSDLDIIYKKMTSSEPYKVNKDLLTKNVNVILNEFYYAWSSVDSESPYGLLTGDK